MKVKHNGVIKDVANGWAKDSGVWKKFINSVGEDMFTTPGTHTWIAPPGITSISVVCVGAGSSGTKSSSRPHGGGGGALAYKNAISVTPGASYTVTVGVGGTRFNGYDGGDSSFGSTVIAGGGKSSSRAGGTVIAGDGGGAGGEGGESESDGMRAGGGGAGGYSGAGGKGGNGTDNSSRRKGADGSGGGGGGGGGASNKLYSGGAGGGVRLHGSGTSGAGGAGGTSPENGSVGSANLDPVSRSSTLFGSGSVADTAGAHGAVRIIYPGNDRQFPSTRTQDEGQS